MALRGLAVLGVLLWGCGESRPVATSAEDLLAAVHALQQAAAEVGLCQALKDRMSADAIVLAPVPLPKDAWTCDYRDATAHIHLVEVAAAGDFGYTAGTWQAMDSTTWQVSVWRLQPDSTWMVEANVVTLHPLAATRTGPMTRLGVGWVRASRKLYQEAARVAMLKADRDMAMTSMDVGAGAAFVGALADSVLYLSDGQALAEGRQAALERIQQQAGMMTWVPVYGAIGVAGDLGYTYGLQTVRPLLPDTVLHSRAYLRIWRARPDSTWQVVANVQARAAPGEL